MSKQVFPPDGEVQIEEEKVVIERTPAQRAHFLQKVYQALAIGLFAFAGLSLALQYTTIPSDILKFYMNSGWTMLIALGLLFLGTILGSMLANTSNKITQYVGLLMYAGIEALFFAPLFHIATGVNKMVVPISFAATLVAFILLTIIALRSAKTFKKWRAIVVYGSIIALCTIVASIIFSFQLGVWFSAVMALFIGVCILYDTATVLEEYEDSKYVAAGLVLLSSFLTLFWYIIRLVLTFFDND